MENNAYQYPRVCIVGAGNMAYHLAMALKGVGCTIVQVWSRGIDRAIALASMVNSEPICELSRLSRDVDLCVIAVPDNAIANVAAQINVTQTCTVVHTSGGTDINVLSCTGSLYGVLWSPQSFVSHVAMDYSSLPLCIESSCEQVERFLFTLFRRISSSLYSVSSEQRCYLHLAATMVNNFCNALNATAEELLQEHNLPFELLHPIIQSTTNKAHHGDLWKQQTGPAQRRDTATIGRHLELIKNNPQLSTLYRAITDYIMSRNATVNTTQS